MDIEFKHWGLSLDFYNQWQVMKRSQDFRWNWIDFTFIHLEFEYSPYKSSAEIQLGILGFNWTLTTWKRIKVPELTDLEKLLEQDP